MKSTRELVEENTAKVKPMSDSFFTDAIPDKPETAICEKHGEFEFKYTACFGGKILQHSSCMECISERNLFIDSEVARIKNDEESERVFNKILESGVSKRNVNKTFSTYNAETPEQTKAKALYKEFSNSVCNDLPVKNLIVCGSVGTGKTHLASSTVNEVSRTTKKCKLINIIDLIREFKGSWAKDSNYTEQDFLNYYTNIDALIIDEVGVQFGSDTEKMIVFDIINGRYNNILPTILISNLALPDVKELIGERAIDRLREDGGVVVAMKWNSHRGL